MATGALIRKPESSGTYSYSSKPRVVQPKQKYRDDVARPANIMFDRRVVRGNTYALHTLPASAQPDPMEVQRQQELRRRLIARRRAREQMRVRSPPPVEGRRHTEVQTELYLEEITDRIEESDVHTQTDAFLDRPPTPLFIPAKTGMDASTQILEGDLFNFDLEVRPILEVLVGKTMEQALLEVAEEEELAALREQQRIFEENRNAEFVETQRLEEQERRRREEKDRRKSQQHEALMKEKETAEKIASRAFAQSYLSDLVPAVFSNLSENGFFYDPVERDLENNFMPWLLAEAGRILDRKLVSRGVLDEIIKNVVRRKLGISTPKSSHPGSPTEEATPITESEGKEKDEHQEPPVSEDKEVVEPEESKAAEQASTSEQLPSSEEPEASDDQGEKVTVADDSKDGESELPATTDEPKADKDDQPSSTGEAQADMQGQDEPPTADQPKDEQKLVEGDDKMKSEEAPTEDPKKEESEPVPVETTKEASPEAATEEESGAVEEKETGEDGSQQDPPEHDVEDTTAQSDEAKEQ